MELASEKMTQKTVTRSAIIMSLLAMLFYSYEYYLRVVPSVMSAELKEAFTLSEAAFGHLAACYNYAYTPMQIPVGIMMDRFGPRKILTFACFLCTVGTYFFATTQHLWVALMGRFLVGFGSAFAYVGVLKIANVWLPSRYFAFMAGLCTTLGVLGGITGKISLSHLVEFLGWQPTLYYAIFVGAILTLILWLVLRDKTNKNHERNKIHSGEPHIHGVSLKKENKNEDIVGVQLVGLWEILKNKQLWINGCIACLIYLPITTFAEIWADSFLQTAGMSRQNAAYGSSMVLLGFGVGAPIWACVSDWMKSRRKPLIIGAFTTALIMTLIILEPSSSKLWMYPLLFSAGFFAGAEIIIFAVGNDLSASSISATTAAFMNTFTMIGGAFVPPLVGFILDRYVQLSGNMPAIPIQPYSFALMLLPAGLVLCGILSIILKETYRK